MSKRTRNLLSILVYSAAASIFLAAAIFDVGWAETVRWILWILLLLTVAGTVRLFSRKDRGE